MFEQGPKLHLVSGFSDQTHSGSPLVASLLKQQSKPGRMNKSISIDSKLSVIGLGLTGTLLSAGFANKGHKVIAVDMDIRKVNSINRGFSPIQDKEIQRAVSNAKNKNKLVATSDLHNAILNTDVSLVCVGNPQRASEDRVTSNIMAVCQQIGASLTKKDGYHLIIVHCGLRPDMCSQQLVPTIEHWSNLDCGREFGMCYLPLYVTHNSNHESSSFVESILHGAYDTKSAKLATKLFMSLDIGLRTVRLDTA